MYSFSSKLHRQDAMQSLLTSAGGDETMMTTAQASMLNPSYCFSIRFRGDWTLDLMMLGGSNNLTTPDRDTILDALDNVLETYQRQKRLVSNDVLLLRYHWMDAVSDKVGTLAAPLLLCLSVCVVCFAATGTHGVHTHSLCLLFLPSPSPRICPN